MLHDMNCYDIDHELLCFGIGFGGVRSLANFIQMSCDELVFWFSEYVVMIMLFKLSLVLQEGSAGEA